VVTDEGGQRFFDYDRAIANMNERNQFRDQLDIETIGVAWRGEKWAFGFSHRNRFRGLVDIPKTLAQLVFQGNAQFIGQTVDVAPYFRLTNINEFSFSAAYQVSDVLSVGGRVKYLSGAADLSATSGQLNLTTSDDVYQLELDPEYTINAAGALDYEGFEDFSTDIDPTAFNLDNLGKNSGVGFDLGVQLDFDQIRIQASALDLGSSVNWTEDVTNLQFDQPAAFGGLDVLRDLLEDSISIDNIVDSIEMEFEPKETSIGYSTNIGARYLLGFEYDLTEQLTAGALAHYQEFERGNVFSFALSARYRFSSLLSVGAVYSYRPNSAANLGLNALVHLGPVDLLLATDNALTLIDGQDARQANVRVGLSVSLFKIEQQ
jgi:opacity protein-like surface antigen